MSALSFEQLTGRCEAHLIAVPTATPGFVARLIPEAAAAYLQLAREAELAGIGLNIASSHRSFDRQLLIWNAKASGQRAVLDDAGCPLDVDQLSESERVFAILRWSALPGSSRHHWGTDVDVYDSAALPADYQVQLSLEETRPGGVFGSLHQWLDARLAEPGSTAFFRPFERDEGGVAPEPWHLSYSPAARDIERQLDEQRLRDFIATQPIALRHVILNHFEEIYGRFIAPRATRWQQCRGEHHVVSDS